MTEKNVIHLSSIKSTFRIKWCSKTCLLCMDVQKKGETVTLSFIFVCFHTTLSRVNQTIWQFLNQAPIRIPNKKKLNKKIRITDGFSCLCLKTLFDLLLFFQFPLIPKMSSVTGQNTNSLNHCNSLTVDTIYAIAAFPPPDIISWFDNSVNTLFT